MSTPEELLRLVSEGQPRAVLLVSAVGDQCTESLASYAASPTPKVRRVALYCLTELGGPSAVRAFVAAVDDRDAQVRGAAFAGLRAHPAGTEHEAKLVASLRAPADLAAGEELALLLGRLPSPPLAALREVESHAPSERVRLACTAALARAGDARAREEFARRLSEARGEAYEHWADLAEYAGGEWLLDGLVPALADETPILRIGVDALPEAPHHLTARDVAARLVAAWTGATFTFAGQPVHNLDDAEAEEVRTVALAHARRGR
jgi:hypothetical protein